MQNFTDVKAAIDLRERVRQDIGSPSKEGEPAQWLCPFHGDNKTPSLAVWPDHFHCFGCGAHGDVFDWEMQRTGCDFKAAKQTLTGEERPMSSRPKREVARPAPMPKRPPPDEWQDAATQVIVDCYAELWRLDGPGQRARQWLAARGLQEQPLKDRWIGFNDKAQTLHGLWVERGIVIPHGDDSQETWGIKVRKSDLDPEPKYIHVKGSVPYMYGVETLNGHDSAFVCEGEFDAILLHQFIGDRAGVFTFGSATNHDLDTWLRHLVSVKRLYIATDNDDAGVKAWEFWRGTTNRARRAMPPNNAKDITDAWKSGVDLRAWALAEMGSCST